MEDHNITYSFRLFSVLLLAIYGTTTCISAERSVCEFCDNNCGHVALKSNLLHDALLTPDIGVEMVLPRNFSVGLEGVYAWWSKSSEHRYWRIRGIWLDLNYWFGRASAGRDLSGHHVGVYGSCHDFDFEFGHKGWQSPRPTFGAGVSYGYSFRLSQRLNLDVSVRAGYTGGNITVYIPQCGRYVCSDRYFRHYIGLTGVAVTLVWFPGRGSFNNPSR